MSLIRTSAGIIVPGAPPVAEVYADDFTGTDGESLITRVATGPDGGWTWTGFDTNGFWQIASNEAAGIRPGSARHNVGTPVLPSDCWVEVLWGASPGSATVTSCVFVRCTSPDMSTANWVGFYVGGSGSAGMRIIEAVGGVVSADLASMQGEANNTIRLTCTGTNANLKNLDTLEEVNATVSVTDSGRAGFVCLSNPTSDVFRADNFRASSI